MDATPTRVLIVEDSPDERALALHALSEGGVASGVAWAAHGAAALDLVGGATGAQVRAGLRLVLLDIKLPGLDGMEVLRRLKADEATRRIPVVMLTSSGEPRDVTACYDLGANGYVVKAVDFQTYARELVAAVRYWTTVNTSVTAEGLVLRPPCG